MWNSENQNSRVLQLGVAAAAGALSALLLMRARKSILSSNNMFRTGTLHPQWQPPAKMPPPFANTPADMLSMKPSELKSPYSFFISAVVPRPIAFVSSISSNGVVNLSPFSYFGLVNHDPGTVVFSCVTKGREGGDTLKNVKATKQFVLHIMSEWYLEAANHTCGNFAPEVNEFVPSGLTQVPSVVVGPPRVGEAAIQLECTVETFHPMTNDKGLVSATMVIGKVVMVHVNRNVFNEEKGTVKSDVLRPMSRLGGNTYGLTRDMFDLARPRINGGSGY